MFPVVSSFFSDLVVLRYPELGGLQFIILVGVTIFCTAMVVTDYFCVNKIWTRFFGISYVTTILFIGLCPKSSIHPYNYRFLGFNEFNPSDFLINFLGFIPLGYLLKIRFEDRCSVKKSNNIKMSFIVTGFGALVSLFLESSQYYFIPGRVSSSIDLIANILGTMTGVVLFFGMNKIKKHKEYSDQSVITSYYEGFDSTTGS